ncbi:HlyC/CorC family transporter [Candidatus Woesearchaeota archaeon]|nr:MAG: HlyC/CorC family transporter [Candidatus Woesearchaeota archaeon]
MLGTLIVFLILLGLSGFFSSAEVVMLSLSRLQVRRLIKHKRKHAERLAKLKENPHKLLQAILIGNNLVNIGAAAIATQLSLMLFGSAGVAIATGVVTFLVLLFGEIIPKSIGINHAKEIALFITPIMSFLTWALTPLIIVIDAIAKIFTRLFGEAEKERVTEEEISDLLSLGEKEGMIKQRERKMIQNIFKFDDTSVDEIMTPRLDVFLLDMHERVRAVMPDVIAHGFTRIPVYDQRMDNIKGVVNTKDLLATLHEGKDCPLSALMKPVLFVPENKKLDSLLREFQKKRAPFAVVLDEHGLFIGIVTIEDLLEELVGELYDENDADVREVRKVESHTFLVSAKALVEDLNEDYGFKLPESEEYDTLGGLIMARLGRIPSQGEELRVGHVKLTVEKMARNRIVTVRINKIS